MPPRQSRGASFVRLVVHRDLKPSNILVDETGEPKLLDFGTARLMPEAGADDSVTLFRFVTPRYASPEALHHGPVTTQTDVFSLGVLLYEQITGARPFGDSPAEAVRRITAGEMSPPQDQITEAGAAARSVSVRELAGVAAGDLTKILERATRAELSERYGSVAELSDDLRAYLEGRPVKARAATVWYVAGKFLRRHWATATLAAVTALGLAGAAIYSRAQAQIAQRRFLEVRQMANYLVGDIHGGLRRIPGSTPLQREVVERSLQYLDELARESQGDRELQLQVVEGYQKLGDVLGNPYRSSLGDSRAALDTYGKALQTLEPVLQTEPGNRRARRAGALLRLHQAGTKGFGGAAKAGLDQIDLAVAELRILVAEQPNDEAMRLDLAEALEFQSNRLRSGGGTIETAGMAQIDRLYAESMEQVEILLAASPGRPAVVRQAALTGFGAALLWGSSDPVRSIRFLRGVEARISELPEAERQGLDVRKLQANVYQNLGFAQGQIREYPAAIDNFGRAEEFIRVWTTIDPANASARYLLSGVYRGRGLVHSYAGENEAAAKDFLAAAETHRTLLELDPENRVYRYLRGEMLVRAGNLLAKAGKLAEAKVRTAEGLGLIVQLASDPKPAITHVFGACRWLVECEVREQRNPALAARYCEQAAAATEGADPDAWLGLSQAREQMGDRPGALAAAERALSLVPPPRAGEPASRQRIEMESNRDRLR
jgi:eukaryotic-like serine/threonine-protein kinase